MDKTTILILVHIWLILVVVGWIKNRDGNVARDQYDLFNKFELGRQAFRNLRRDDVIRWARVAQFLIPPTTIFIYGVFVWTYFRGH